MFATISPILIFSASFLALSGVLLAHRNLRAQRQQRLLRRAR